MTRNEKILATLVLILSIAMPFVARYSFKTGYFTAKEIWRGSVVIVPPQQCPPRPPKGVSVEL
jgi:hypothetical protein